MSFFTSEYHLTYLADRSRGDREHKEVIQLKRLLLAVSGTLNPESTIIDFWKRLNIKNAMFMVAGA